jgi:hypothetical protein
VELMEGKRLVGLALAIALIALIGTGAALATHPSPLPDIITTPNFSYNIRFTDDNPPPATDANYMPNGQSQNMANALDNNNAAATGNPNGYHPGYTNQGFLAPSFGGSNDVFVFNCSDHGGCDSGNAPADRINMPVPNYINQTEACIRLVVGHELFHHVQYAYITFAKWSIWGNMPIEGAARMIQDKIYNDLDGNAGCITYGAEVNGFLGNPNRTIWDISYTSALFWSYLSEQLGAFNTEPAIGLDFVQWFWQNAQANNASPDVVATMRRRSPSSGPAKPSRTCSTTSRSRTTPRTSTSGLWRARPGIDTRTRTTRPARPWTRST